MISPLTKTNEKEKSAFRNLSYSKRDVYYRKAKEEGFRARSVYKLKEIHYNYNILTNSSKFVDLCAAPGSWSQMLRILTKSNPEAKIVSVDIQDIVPIEGVNIVKGDIRELNHEVLRVLRMMPKWIPGQRNGHPIRSQVTLPVEFEFDDQPFS